MADLYVMFEQNMFLAYSALSRYFPDLATDEDMQQLAFIGLWKACRNYSEDRGAFSTLAFPSIRNEVLHYLVTANRKKRSGVTASIDSEFRTENEDGFGSLSWSARGAKDVEWVDWSGFMAALKKDRHRKIVQLRCAGFRNYEIAAALQCTRQTVDRDMLEIRRIFDRYI